MVKIALLVPSFYYGGSKRSVANIANVLSKHYEVIVVQFDTSENIYNCNCEIIDLKCPVRKCKFLRAINRLVQIFKYSLLLKRRKIDLSISFIDGANRVNYYSHSSCKKIISSRGFGDLIRLEKPYVKMVRRIDGILFNSKVMHSYFAEKYPDLSDKAYVANNIYDMDLFNEYLKDEETEIEFNNFIRTHKTIVSVGRMSKEKGHTHLLKSFEILKSQVNDAGLVIIGDGVESSNIHEMVKMSNFSDDILLCGFKENPYKYVKKCDVSALTSINEGFPNVIVEAMGCGVPIVSTNCKTGPNEILNERYDDKLNLRDIYYGDYGILTPVFDSSLDYSYENYDESHYIYAKALGEMLLDYKLNQKYRNASLKRFKDFTPDVTVKIYIDIIENIINTRI